MKRRRFSMDSCSLTSLFASPSLYKDRLRTTADRPFNPIPPNFPAREIPNPNSIPIVFQARLSSTNSIGSARHRA